MTQQPIEEADASIDASIDVVVIRSERSNFLETASIRITDVDGRAVERVVILSECLNDA